MNKIPDNVTGVNQELTPKQIYNQAQTPPSVISDALHAARELLPWGVTQSCFDPQAGRGNMLLRHGKTPGSTHAYGCDPDIDELDADYRLITGNAMQLMGVVDDVYPSLTWDMVNAFPPDRRTRTKTGEVIDVTEWTWQQCVKRGRFGVFVCSADLAHKFGIPSHPYVKLTIYRPSPWPGVTTTIAIVVWHNPATAPTKPWDIANNWHELNKIVREERGLIPPHNIWINGDGRLLTYLSARFRLKHGTKYREMEQMAKVNDQSPVSLVQERSTRKLLESLVNGGQYSIAPDAEKAIRDAILDYNRVSAPIMPPTEFSLVAYSDEEDELECVKATWGFEEGKRYKLETDGYKYATGFKRRKISYDSAGNGYGADHQCMLSGMDRMILVTDSHRTTHKFRTHCDPKAKNDHPESMLWDVFKKPAVKTIADRFPEAVERNRNALAMLEMMGGFKYYPGQIEYLVRVGVKDCAMLAADTGAGKTLFAISMIAMKGAKRVLIVAPQGMVKSEDADDEVEVVQEASQWMGEIKRFAPFLKVHQLFSMEDYNELKGKNNGVLPCGVFVTYYEGLFSNGARESCPASWTDAKVKEMFKFPMDEFPEDERGYVKTIGKEHNGIRCILTPSMSTLIGHEFDMVLVDESHKAAHGSALVTQMLIRMQPKYRYALSATPIPNVCADMFPIMGWLSVDDWYKGDRRNAAWPYARNELKKFTDTFQSTERDLTEEEKRKAKDNTWRGKVERVSPTISSPARLIKLLSSTMAYISKEQCNPNLVKRQVIDVRVPIGSEQGRLYAHFSNRRNIPIQNPLQAARVQIAYLRGITADPAGFPVDERGGPRVSSNFNPKTIAILNVIKGILDMGEQFIVVAARVGQSNTLQQYLQDAGVTISRIDSTVPANKQSFESNKFKSGRSRGMLMGIKCAQGFSFPACPNLIIGSLDYSFGSKHQAEGRVYRVNSQKDVKVWCVLHSNTIEETIFDAVGTKEDAATMCLLGRRVPRDHKPVDMAEVMAEACDRFHLGSTQSESDCLNRWPSMRDDIRDALSKHGKPLQSGSTTAIATRLDLGLATAA